RLCALPAAAPVPRAHPEARPHRAVPTRQGLGRGTGRAPLDAQLPAGRVRGDVSPGGEGAQQVDLAIRRGLEGRRGLTAPRHALLAVAVAVAAPLAAARADSPAQWPDTPVARLEAVALIETLNAEILASRSATFTLEKWCADHRLSGG